MLLAAYARTGYRDSVTASSMSYDAASLARRLGGKPKLPGQGECICLVLSDRRCTYEFKVKNYSFLESDIVRVAPCQAP